MIQQQNQYKILTAKVKAQIFRQIFKDLNQKDLEGCQQFYIIFSNEGAELQFLSGGKVIMITIILKKNLFSSYSYNIEKKSLHKYLLDDFMIIGFLFENNKTMLELQLTPNNFILSYRSGSEQGSFQGRQILQQTQFVGQDLRCNQDDEEKLIGQNQIRPQQQNYMQLKIQRVNNFEEILNYARIFKIENLFFRFDSIKKKLQISNARQQPPLRWAIKILQINKNNFNSQLSFSCKMLNCAINLLDHDKQLILTFYPQFLLMDVPEQQKNFTVKISANVNMDLQFSL